MKFILPLIALLVFSTIVVSCKKIQPEMTTLNEECDCAKEVSAAFLMEELATPINFSGYQKQTDTDTMYAGRNVRFYALEPNANYTWYIGNEVITEREFYRFFDNSFVGQTFDMTLVVEKTPNLICLPNDDGRDTITRQLTVVADPGFNFNSMNHPRFEGTFRVIEKNSLDSIDITFEVNDVSTWDYKMTNYDGMGGEKTMSDIGMNYRQLWFSGACFASGYFLNSAEGKVEIVFFVNSTSSCLPYQYKGRKL